jgi:hypothetical protein
MERDDDPSRDDRGQPLFTFLSGNDRVVCALRDDGGERGVEAQFLENGACVISQRFETSEQAMRWAIEEREALKAGERQPGPGPQDSGRLPRD